ncbi:MAG TPA: endonuclease/exonuclease/phosphatase family protein [Galbitalea sp.]|jgi:endonuclease/exonuclease/phosphatase (EEP) superfamily protein YafD
MIRRIVAAVFLVAIAATLFVVAWPEGLGLQAQPIVAQVIALRGLDVVIALGLVVVVLLAALVWRSAGRFFGAAAVLLILFVLAVGGILELRGFGASTVSAKAATDVTVLSWNTKGGAPGPETIAKLAIAQHADIIALPETTQETGVEIEAIMRAAGRPMWVLSAAHGYIYSSHATTLLVSSALGSYSVNSFEGDTSVSSTVIAEPNQIGSPVIVAVHAVSPKPQEMRNWRSDLRYLATRCTGGNLIMAGDFNATLDHLRTYGTDGHDFGSCTDSGAASRGAALGSWPTSLPQLLGAQIDHVMYGNTWKVVAMKVVGTEDTAGSDHRPVVTTLARNP